MELGERARGPPPGAGAGRVEDGARQLAGAEVPDHPAVGDLYRVGAKGELRGAPYGFASSDVEPAVVLGALDDAALEVAVGKVGLSVGAEPVC